MFLPYKPPRVWSAAAESAAPARATPAGLMSAALFGHTLTLNFLIGVTVVFISMHIFFSMGKPAGRGAAAALPLCDSCVQPGAAGCRPACRARLPGEAPERRLRASRFAAPAGGSKGKEVRPSKLAVSPSMEHMDVLPAGSVASSRNISTTELAAASAAGEALPLMAHAGEAAARRAPILPR